MKKVTLIISGLLATASANSLANNLAIDIGNDSFAAELVSTGFSQNSKFSLGIISAENNQNVYSFKALVTGKVQSANNLSAAMGAKLYFIDTKRENAQGLALGGEVNYQLPSNKLIDFDIAAYIAPNPTLTDDFDYLTDITAKASYSVLPNGKVYISYRNIKAEHEDYNTVTINNGFNIGFDLKY